MSNIAAAFPKFKAEDGGTLCANLGHMSKAAQNSELYDEVESFILDGCTACRLYRLEGQLQEQSELVDKKSVVSQSLNARIAVLEEQARCDKIE